jgi:hypothetical protein
MSAVVIAGRMRTPPAYVHQLSLNHSDGYLYVFSHQTPQWSPLIFLSPPCPSPCSPLHQAPLALHLPLCVLDWGVASYVSNLIDGDLGAPQQGWIQHCLDGLLIVGVPVAAALLMQHTACTGGSSVPDTSWTPSSSSKAGAPSSSHTHSRHQQQLTHNTTVSPAGPSTAQGRAQTVLAAASPATACVQLRSRKQRSRGAGVHGEGAGPQQGASPYAAAARGAPAPAAARHAPDPAAMRLSAAPYSPTLITAGPAGPGAPHHQQLLPALVASCVYEGWRGLPPECLYTPVTRLVPVNLKVSARAHALCSIYSQTVQKIQGCGSRY